jgi:hypothetical protein
MSIKSKSRRKKSGYQSPGVGDKRFNRQTFDVVVDVPDTEGFERFCESTEDLLIVCLIDEEEVFQHTYAEREKKMRVSFMPQDQQLGFQVIDSVTGDLVG